MLALFGFVLLKDFSFLGEKNVILFDFIMFDSGYSLLYIFESLLEMKQYLLKIIGFFF